MTVNAGDTGELGTDTPRPVHADSVSNGTFDKLEEGQGAVAASNRRGGAHMGAHAAGDAHDANGTHAAESAHAAEVGEQLTIDRRTLIVVVIGALAAIVVIVVLFINVLNASPAKPKAEPEADKVVAQAGDSITSRGASYHIAQNGEKYQLMETRDGGKEVSLGDIAGTPAGLVLYDGAVLIPENLADGKWDVMAYTIGSGWSQIMDRDGKPVSGEGSISDATLDGSTIVLTVNGNRVDVPLTW